MFKKLNYTNKFRLLLVAGLLLIYVAYSFAFKRTIELNTQNKELSKTALQLETAPQKLNELKAKINKLEKNVNAIGNKSVHELILDTISFHCSNNNLTIRQFPPPIIFNEPDYNVETNIIEIEGSFVNLVKLIFHLEQKVKIGKLVSCDFFIKTDNKTRSNALWCKLYIQNIVSNENN